MLGRSVRPLAASAGRSCAAAKRCASNAGALDRLLLDILSAHNADQQRAGEAGEPVKRSAAAKRGLAPRGDVALPRELVTAVDAVINAAGDDKVTIRNSALELWERAGRTALLNPPSSSSRDRQSLSIHYDLSTSVGYLAGLMPSAYAATLNALTVARDRLNLVASGGDGRENERWEPDRLIDFGSGTGSAAWAFEEVWGVQTPQGQPREYVGLEASINMVELSSVLFGALPLRSTTASDSDLAAPATSARLDARAFQVALPASSSTMSKLQLTSKSMAQKRTIALTAFTLGDLASREKRKELVRAMWDSGAEVMIVIDRGTPAGSRMVIEAREQLLMYGRREVARAGGFGELVEVDQDLLDAGFEVVGEAVEEGEVEPSLGSFVVAPCPHDGACPLHHATKAYCHFSQRVQNPPFLRNTKHTTRGQDDAKFSYVVVRRGQRPTLTSAESSSAPSVDDLVDGAIEASVLPSAVVAHDPSVREPDGPVDVAEELARPRLVAPPMKRSKHVILEVCALSGEIERHTIPKSQGRQAYYDARKSGWGDAFPHAPKNGPQPSPTTTFSLLDQLALVDETTGKPRNKFGGNAKQRGKKAEREQGKREARSLREGGRRERSEKKAARRGDDAGFGGFVADSHGVMNVDLELGADGRFRTAQ
ncbi:hypothetical protein JCM8547_004899 [Rhodosporidiobolus lusitaniae]